MQKEQQTAPEMEEEQEYLTQTPSIQWFPGTHGKDPPRDEGKPGTG